jgi:hypothetical protein
MPGRQSSMIPRFPKTRSISVVRITLDTNAIIDLEEGRNSAPAVQRLLTLHKNRKVTLCVSAIAASERDRDREGEPNFVKFADKLNALGLSDVELLNPPGHWGITFWDHCVFAEEGDTLEPNIRDILFPNFLFAQVVPEPVSDRPDRRANKVLNAQCDVLSMWCHIRYRGDIFVTSDRNFRKASKKPRLLALGAGQILNAQDALAFVHRALDYEEDR